MRISGTLLAALALLAVACDRSIEPFDPNEQVEQPDLARIFPEGAKVVAEREAAQGGPMGAGAPPAPPGAEAAAAGGDAPPIEGTLVLSPALEGQIPSGGILFLVARKPEGGPPIAVQRIPSPRFPLPFELGPQDRMIESIPFTGPLLLSARVDGDGNATSREPGDLLGSLADPVEPGDTGITLQIDQKL